MKKTELEVCPNCHQKSLWINKYKNSYECLNSKCSNYNLPISKVSLDRLNQQIEAEKNTLDESTAKARVWSGNQYWDEKMETRRPTCQNPPFPFLGSYHRNLHHNQYCYHANS